MGERRWPTVLIIVILIGLIYNFLNTIFRSDVKRYSQDRIYVDYSTYTKKEAGVEHVEAERPRGFGRKIDQAVQNVFEDNNPAKHSNVFSSPARSQNFCRTREKCAPMGGLLLLNRSFSLAHRDPHPQST